MRRVEFITAAFRSGSAREESHVYLQILLNALVKLDAAYLRFHPDAPKIYESGVRYHREPPGYEQWLQIPCILQQRWGDCEELAAWRVAELLREGEYAWPCFRWRRSKKVLTYHIVVCRQDGAIEDPSRIMGMGWDEDWKPVLAFPGNQLAS